MTGNWHDDPVARSSLADPRVARRRARLTGVDAARGLALIGMMSVHVIRTGSSLDAPLAHEIAAGRSAALFAVLAGVGIALSTGGTQPSSRERLWQARRGVAARAGVVTAIGLTLSLSGTSLFVILPYYGLLFLVALPVLGWGARRLAALAAIAAVLTPVVSHVLRRGDEPVTAGNLDWNHVVTEPGGTLSTLFLTGVYPVLTWSTYLFAGLAVGG